MPKDFDQISLNPIQEEAILTSDGPVLIVAGAGSGKTMVLTHRISNLIDKGINPGSILAITFTNKAAEEMRTRVGQLLGSKSNRWDQDNSTYRGPWIGTFHSFCVYILRNSGKVIGIPRGFTIMDEEDALSMIKEALRDIGLDPKKIEARKIRNMISKKKNEMIGHEDMELEASGGYFGKIMLEVWRKYEEKLGALKALDFDDLLLKTVFLFSRHPDVLAQWQERFKYIHVDEYQDTNLVQYHLTKLLALKYRNLCVVGDIDQAIYSWRGADFRNIMHFERDWPEAKIITLEENYRSTQLILDAANAVIVKNKARLPKNLYSKKKAGPKIILFEAANEEEEALFVAGLAKSLVKEGMPPRDIAVLYRTNFQSRILEEKMLEGNISYQVIGVKFYERKEIKNALAYLKAAINPEDLLSLKRIINFPPRGIGKILLTKILASDSLNSKEEKKVGEFREILASTAREINEKKASDVIRFLIRNSGIEEYYNDTTEEGEMRMANIQELVTLAKRYDSMTAPEGILKLLEDAALMSDQDTMKKEENSIKLMTVHAAKGLEFKAIFIAGLEEGLFPHASMSNEEEDGREEEERRLFYVALTRSKEKIYLSYAIFRTIFGERRINLPSKFLFDIPEELLEKNPENIITLD